jgi:hypothetical protein
MSLGYVLVTRRDDALAFQHTENAHSTTRCPQLMLWTALHRPVEHAEAPRYSLVDEQGFAGSFFSSQKAADVPDVVLSEASGPLLNRMG